MIKVLNLYAGIGGNRKLWENVEVTAVEYDKATAEEYKKNFPNDIVIVADAHQYLLDHYKEFDFIWASPPCPTHSDIRRMAVDVGSAKPLYPDMKLYEEIILLLKFCKTKYCIENVKPYYEPLIKPSVELDRHYFWTNFYVSDKSFIKEKTITGIYAADTVFGFNVKESEIKDKRKALRNMVNPKVAKHILECAFKKKQQTLI